MKEKGGLDKVGQGRKRLANPRPGGMRDGRILRFAEAGTDSAGCFCFVPLTRLSPTRGWPYSIEGPLGRAHRRPSIYALHTVSDRRREACNQKPAIA